MTLALRLGRTVHELTQTITASELKMWIEFDRLSPIGDKRGDIQAALVASSVYRSQGGKATLDDMLLRWGHSQKRMTVDLDSKIFWRNWLGKNRVAVNN